MNKKGNILDWFFILAVLLMTGIAIFTAYIIINTVDESQIFADEPTAQAAIDTTKSTILSFDNMMLFVIVGLSIFVLVSSALVFNHPAFFVTGAFLLFIAVTVAAVVSNTFWKFTVSDKIASTAALFPKVNFLMENLPFYVLFMGVAATIVMYISYKQQ